MKSIRNIFLALLCVLSDSGSAIEISRDQIKHFDPGWVSYIEACDTYHDYSRDLAPGFRTGAAWEPQLSDALQEIDSFLEKDCRAYNESRNSPDLLAAFVPRLQSVSGKVSLARMNGLAVSSRLMSASVRLKAIYKKLGLDPRESPCISKIEERAVHSQQRMQSLLQRTQKVEKLCPIAEKSTPKASALRVYGQGAPEALPSRKRVLDASSSDITGTQKAAKEAQQSEQKAQP